MIIVVDGKLIVGLGMAEIARLPFWSLSNRKSIDLCVGDSNFELSPIALAERKMEMWTHLKFAPQKHLPYPSLP